jgi:hypothetical protein
MSEVNRVGGTNKNERVLMQINKSENHLAGLPPPEAVGLK